MKRWGLSTALSILISAALAAQAPQSATPTFKAGVEYVEVDARVVDAGGREVLDLSRNDFQILEDGVAQDIAAFSLVNLPRPATVQPSSRRDVAPVVPVRSDVASNARPAEPGRVYLLAFEDRFITPSNTNEVRRLMREFVDRYVGPQDLAAVITLGYSRAFQGFTNDRRLLAAAIDGVIGAKGLSPTVDALTNIEQRAALSPLNGSSPAPPDPAATTDSAIGRRRESQRQLLEITRAMSAMGGQSKAILLIGEGVLATSINDLESLALSDDLRSGGTVDRQSNIPVYPIDPRGLDDGSGAAIEVGTVSGGLAPTVSAGLSQEIRTSKESLLRIAEDTGGAAALGNDFDGAFDRIVRRSSSYYVLGYNSKNAQRDGKFRSIQVKVARPGVTVVARRGYTASSNRAPAKPSYPGPSGTSESVRQALNSGLPMSGLAFAATAAPFRQRGSDASVAVVIEASGKDLALAERNGAFTGSFEVLVAALDNRGAIKSSDVKQLTFNLTPEIHDRVTANGFRWLSRLAVKPGRYQLRVAAASGPEKRGSVWYDLEVPDFSAGDLVMSGVLVVSAAAFQTPTVKPDKELDALLPGPPTTARTFPSGDELMVLAETYANRSNDTRDLDVTVTVRNAQGIERFRTTQSATADRVKSANGMLRTIAKIPVSLVPGDYVLTIEAQRRGDSKTVSRAVPFRVG